MTPKGRSRWLAPLNSSCEFQSSKGDLGVVELPSSRRQRDADFPLRRDCAADHRACIRFGAACLRWKIKKRLTQSERTQKQTVQPRRLAGREDSEEAHRRSDLGGVPVENVGAMSRFLEKPDISGLRGIKSLSAKCRICRVLFGRREVPPRIACRRCVANRRPIWTPSGLQTGVFGRSGLLALDQRRGQAVIPDW